MSNNTHVQNTANAIKNLIEPYNLELTSDMEYMDSGDTCNLTATLTDLDDMPVAGELLYYTIIDSAGAILDEAPIFTDANGIADLSYTDGGTVGNVTVHVYGRMFLHKTYKIYTPTYSDPTEYTEPVALNFLSEKWMIKYILSRDAPYGSADIEFELDSGSGYETFGPMGHEENLPVGEDVEITIYRDNNTFECSWEDITITGTLPLSNSEITSTYITMTHAKVKNIRVYYLD